jgi:hypothetical protein
MGILYLEVVVRRSELLDMDKIRILAETEERTSKVGEHGGTTWELR